MALRTLGTASTTSLKCLVWYPGGMSTTDAAALAAYMVPDQQPGNSSAINGRNQGWFKANGGTGGQLYLPDRNCWIKLLPGDVVAVDTQTGWPILVSKKAAASNPAWVLT